MMFARLALVGCSMGTVVSTMSARIRCAPEFGWARWSHQSVGGASTSTWSIAIVSGSRSARSLPARSSLLIAWVGGPGAAALSNQSLCELEASAVESLAAIFALRPGTVRERLQATYYHNWANDPFARGAYSYPLVGGHRASVRLAKPIQDTIWFAGEAADREGRTGTVHDAIASGWRAADEILER
ncbi:MAG: FAD-dependent oxidoreductase [bacterium]